MLNQDATDRSQQTDESAALHRPASTPSAAEDAPVQGESIPRLQRFPMLGFAAMLIAGGVSARLLPAQPQVYLACLTVLCVVLLASHWIGRWRQIALAAAACFGMGALYDLTSRPPKLDGLSPTATRQSQAIAVRATITSAATWKPNPNHRPQDPDSLPWQTQWQVRCESVRDGGHWRAVDARSTLQVAGRVDKFLPGDRVEVFGSYRGLTAPTNPGAFDFAHYSRQEHRLVTLAADDVEQLRLLESSYRHPWRRLRALAIRHVDRNLTRWIAPEHAPLAAALVFGQRQQVDWQDQQELMATGTLHMLAISGMHVEIVAWGVIACCLLCATRDPWRVTLVVAICVLYACLAGGKPPVVRAVVLVAAFECARVLGRRARLANLLGLAAVVLFVMSTANVGKAGVHLSFLAVAAIGIFVVDRGTDSEGRAFSRLLDATTGRAQRSLRTAATWLGAMLRLSFWVWIVTCPLVWANFHVIAPISIALNVLIAFPLCVALLSGLVTGLVGGLAPPIGYLSGKLCSGSLHLITEMVAWGASVPGGHFWLPAPNPVWLTIFFGTLVAWLLLLRRKHRGLLAVWLCGWLACGMGWTALPPAASEEQALVVTFLDVGHGTSVIIQPPHGKIWLYDAGHLGSSERSHQEIANALWAIGASKIDTLILSHADADHYNAVPGLIERFRIGRVVSTSQFWESSDHQVQQVVAQLRRANIPRESWVAGDRGSLGNTYWQVLHPAANQRFESDNASSLCLLFHYAERRILLPGDLDGTGLLELMTLPDRPCHLLMAPHHGSLSHDPTALLEWCRPDWVVISGNHRALRPAVLREYAAAPTLVTFRDGALQYRVRPDGQATMHRWLQRQWTPIELP